MAVGMTQFPARPYRGTSASVCPTTFLGGHRDRAHRRYLQAVKALAQVRKLLGASVTQVNIAENQVNVAGRLRAPST
ncbi:unnamed protein product [marine sediment metagenome]|uniref:Uncharacterized protein n=1 Tax=marine sediment metagenome TaxID=412755 RepID=X0TY34_9ZZZZ